MLLVQIMIDLHFPTGPLKDRLLWCEADIEKRLYLRHYFWDFDIIYTK